MVISSSRSYSSVDYKDILTYSATRVDPEVREPTGEYDLRNAIDFRPKIDDIAGTILQIEIVISIVLIMLLDFHLTLHLESFMVQSI